MDGMDQERRELVGRLRAIIGSAFQAPPPEQSFEQQARPAAAYPFRWNTALQEVRRIARRHGWEDEINQALAETGVPALKYMEAGQLERLLERMRALQDALYTPCDPPDSPPAR
ncbi:MAG TPA: hypothetical protein VEY92_13620 [Pseudoxanthomonas sp.]|nr:hypothetical protein [Pseudoxanthomonas sp.]